MDSLVSLSVFVHIHCDRLLAQGLAINGSLIIIRGVAEPSHPKEKDRASKEHDCISPPSPPFCRHPTPSSGLQAEKYEIPTKKEQLDVRCRATAFPLLHRPSKMLATGLRYHYPDF